jgi:hypothetical protein
LVSFEFLRFAVKGELLDGDLAGVDEIGRLIQSLQPEQIEPREDDLVKILADRLEYLIGSDLIVLVKGLQSG